MKNPTNENKLDFTRQRNFCVSLLRKEKKQYFAKLDEKNITVNRKFWQTAKPFLSDKNKSREKINLLKNEETISDEVEVANTLNTFLMIIVKNLKIPGKFGDYYFPQSLIYKDHPSTHVIKRVSQRFSSFYFSLVDSVLKEIIKLKSNKTIHDRYSCKNFKR